MNLNIINKNFNKYKTTIKPVIDTKIIKKYDYDFDYFYEKDFTKYLKKININDIFCNSGYKYLKLITYKNNNLNINIDMDNSIKKHNMKLWDIWNFKNEHPKPNLDGSIDWKIKWPLRHNGNYISINGKILYFIEKYNKKKDNYDIICYYIDINEKNIKTVIINRSILKRTLEDYYDQESVDEYFTFLEY